MTHNPPETHVRDYLKNRLSRPERAQFEQRLHDDPALRAELARQRAEMAAAELLIEADARALFRNLAAEAVPEKSRWKFWRIAAAGLLLLAAAFFFFNNLGKNTPPSPAPEPPAVQPPEQSGTAPAPLPKLENALAPKPQARDNKPHKSLKTNYLAVAKRHFLEPNIAAIRSPTAQPDTVQSPIQLAKSAYAAGDFRQALRHLENADAGSSQQAAFLRANAQFHLGAFDAAAENFEQLVRQNSHQFRYPAEWGLLLCRLATGPRRAKDFEKQLAEILTDPDHPYLEQAAALRLELKGR